jgi:hypothetical protein
MAMAILLVVTGIGFGIAQAGGTDSEQPGLSFEDQVIPQVAKSPVADMQLMSEAGRGISPALFIPNFLKAFPRGDFQRKRGLRRGPKSPLESKWRAIPDEAGHYWEETLSL